MTPEQIEKDKERRRLRAKARREMYPEKAKAIHAKYRATPEGKAKELAQRAAARARKIAEGWTPKTKEQKAEQMRKVGAEQRARETPEQIKARLRNSHTPEARSKQKATMLAKGSKAENALAWSLRSPDGRVYQFRNLYAFVRENKHLFTEEQMLPTGPRKLPRIVYAIAALSPRRKKFVEHCCGWRWHIDGKDPESYLAAKVE